MKLSRKWLSEFVTVDANDREFAEAMTLSGSKVEVTEDLGAEIENVVVGKVLTMKRHENSDHMWVCQGVGKSRCSSPSSAKEQSIPLEISPRSLPFSIFFPPGSRDLCRATGTISPSLTFWAPARSSAPGIRGGWCAM